MNKSIIQMVLDTKGVTGGLDQLKTAQRNTFSSWSKNAAKLELSLGRVKTKEQELLSEQTKLNNAKFFQDRTGVDKYTQSIKKLKHELSLLKIEQKKARIATSELSSKNTLYKKQISAISQINKQTKQVTKTTRTYTKANKELNASFNVASNNIVRMIRRYESLLVGIYAVKKGYDATLGTGHEYNVLLENEVAGMKILAVQNLQDINTKGEQVTLTEKYTEATKKSVEMLRLAREINPETPFNLGDTIKTYKSLFPQLIKYKASLEDIAEVTKKMTILGKAMNLDTGQFIKTVDTAFTGAMKPSQMQIALNQVGITNELIKKWQESGNLVENILQRLSQIDPKLSGISQNFDTITSNFKTQWDELWGELQKPLFDAIKKEINEAAIYIKENKTDIVELGEEIGNAIEIGLRFGTVYAGLSIALRLNSKLLSLNSIQIASQAKATALAIRYNQAYSTSLTKNAIQLKMLGRALKTFVATNPILIGATVAMAGYELATSKAREQEDLLSDAVGKSRVEVLKLGVVQKEQSEKAIKLKMQELRVQNSIIKARQGGGGSSLRLNDVYDASNISMYDQATKSEKELNRLVELRLEKNNEVLSALDNQLATYESVTIELKEAYDQVQAKTEAIKIENLEIIKIGIALSQNKDLTEEQRATLLDQKTALENNVVELQNSVTQINNQNTALGEVGSSIDWVKGKAEGLSAEFLQGAKNALAMKNALTKSLLVSGEITKQEAENRKYLADAQNANDTLSGEARIVKLLEIDTKYKEQRKRTIDEVQNKQRQANDALLQDQRALYQAQGLGKKALLASIAIVNSKQIPQSRKNLQIEALKLNYQKSQTKESKKTATGISKQSTALNKAEKEAKKYADELAKIQAVIETDKVFLIGGEELVKMKALGDELEKMGHTVSQTDLAIHFEAEISKMSKVSEDFTDNFKGLLEGLFSGDLSGAFKGFMDGTISKMITPMIDSLSSKLSSGMSSLSSSIGGSTGGLFDSIGASLGISGGAVMGGAIGVSIQAAGALLSNTLSEAEIEVAKGRREFESKSIADSKALYEKYQAPQLTVARQQLESLTQLNEQFGQVAIALGGSNGISYDGGDFVDSSSSTLGGLFSSSTDLIGAGISFGEQAIGSLVNGLDVVGYESIKKSSSSLFGLISSEKIVENETEISESLKNDLNVIIQDSFDMVSTNLDVLGFDVDAFNEELSKQVIDIGKIDFSDMNTEEKQVALEGAISEMLDGATSGALNNFASSPNMVASLESMQRVDEEFTTTIARVAIGYETVTQQFKQFGIEIENFNQSQMFIDAAGGLDAFNQGMSTFASTAFFTEEELRAMTESQLQYALAVHNVSLPANKAQYKALVLETQQRMISVQGQIESLKTKLIVEGIANKTSVDNAIEVEQAKAAIQARGGEVTVTSLNAELEARSQLASKGIDVDTMTIKSQQSVIETQNKAGESAVAYGKNVAIGVENMMGAAQSAVDGIDVGDNFDTASAQSVIDGIGQIEIEPINVDFSEYNWEGVSPELDALNAELSDLESLYGTLMQNMDGFADFYNQDSESITNSIDSIGSSVDDAGSSFDGATGAIDETKTALDELAQNLISISNIKAKWSDSQTIGADIKLQAIIEDTGITGITMDNYLDSFLEVSKSLSSEEIGDWDALGDALKSADDATKAYLNTLETNQTSILNLQNAWGDNTALKVAQVELEFAQKRTGIVGVNAINFLDEFNSVVKDGINSDTIKDWEQMSSAIKKVSDAEKELEDVRLTAINEQLKATESFNKTVLDSMRSLTDLAFTDEQKKADLNYRATIADDNQINNITDATKLNYETSKTRDKANFEIAKGLNNLANAQEKKDKESKEVTDSLIESNKLLREEVKMQREEMAKLTSSMRDLERAV